MKKSSFFIVAALAAVGFAIYKLLSGRQKPAAPATTALRTTGTGGAPSFFPGIGTLPIGGLSIPQRGVAGEGGGSAFNVALDLSDSISGIIAAGKSLFDFVRKDQSNESYYLNQSTNKNLVKGPGGEIYQDVGGVVVPTQLPAYEAPSAYDQGPEYDLNRDYNGDPSIILQA